MPFLATYQWTVCIHGLTAHSNPYEIYTSYFCTTEGWQNTCNNGMNSTRHFHPEKLNSCRFAIFLQNQLPRKYYFDGFWSLRHNTFLLISKTKCSVWHSPEFYRWLVFHHSRKQDKNFIIQVGIGLRIYPQGCLNKCSHLSNVFLIFSFFPKVAWKLCLRI